jgi:hypothetical protein
MDAGDTTLGVSDSDQYVFTHYCTLEATRTQGRFSFDDLNDLV